MTSQDLALPTTFSPTSANARIDALDVLRGFALIGICVANVEFFSRPVVESGLGIPAGLHGLDWLAAFLVGYLVTGKFWTIFSLLFGMGFALMLNRAQQAGQPFLPVYGRRIAVLFAIGLLHHSLLWNGDILISYAVGALALMMALAFSPSGLVAVFVLCVALTQYGNSGFAAWALAPVVAAGVAALYLRAGQRWLFPLLMIVPGVLMLVAGGLSTADGMPLAATGILLVALGALAWRYAEPAALRPLRAGAVIVMLGFAMIAFDTGSTYIAPQPAPAATAGTGGTAAERDATDDAAETTVRLRTEAARSRQEERVLTSDGYRQTVTMRVRQLDQRLRDEFGFAVLLLGVFLAGVGLLRSGVIARAAEHRVLLRRLAWSGIVTGVGLGLLGATISMGRPAGADDPAYEFANALAMLGSLPAALGYIAAVLLMLHSGGILGRVRLLAPFGRMALSNYLVQSVVLSTLFYGHGLGWWGIGRAAQVGIALLLCALQIGLSHWWLARFQYGPVEWVWRALTYRVWPAMRAR